MKFSNLASAIALTLIMGTASASDAVCKNFTGTVAQLAPDPACQILNIEKFDKRFPDLTFLHTLGVPGTCFISTFTGTFGNLPVTGITQSGITTNGIDEATVTAATVLSLRSSNGRNLGRVFTHDVIFYPFTVDTKELLIMVDGTRLFKGGKGNISLIGDTLNGPGTVTGKLCIDD